MIRVYQIKLTDEQVVEVNAGKDVPAFNAWNRMMLGASKFSEEYLQYYTKGWEIDTDQLDEAFEVSNGIGDTYKGTRVGRSRSGSVGDIFVDENGDCFICDTFGFAAIGQYNLEAA